MVVDALSVTLRALSFVALFQTAGLAIFLALFGREIRRTAERLRRLGVIVASAALLLISTHYVLEAGRMSGDFSGVMDTSLQRLVLHSSTSTALALRLLGLLLIAVGLMRRSSAASWLALLGAALVFLAFTTVGHTTTHSPRWLLAALLLFHLSVVAFWFGALLPLHTMTSMESPAIVGAIVAKFSIVAAWLVPGLFIAGIALTALLLPNVSALGSPYGRLLLLKVFGFAVLMGLAALNRWRLGPALARDDPRAAATFRKSVLAEYGLIVAILATTAVLTTFYSPED